MWNIRRTVRNLFILPLAGITTLSLAACVDIQPGLSPAVQGMDRLNVCTSSASPTQMNVQFALAEGLFAKYDLDVTVSEISGGSTAVTALIAGDVDLCQIAGAAVVGAGVAGAEVVFVGGVINQQPYYLVTRPDVRTPADLVGQALAVSGPGSSSYAAAVAVLERFGLAPDRDVAILSIGGQSERMAALESGNIAGTILSPPQAMLAVADGYHLLFDFAEIEAPYQHTAIVTTRAFLEEHPDLVAGYIQATSEAVAAMHADRRRPSPPSQPICDSTRWNRPKRCR
jgi:NitT/TauT family transport system substrate-binding protein